MPLPLARSSFMEHPGARHSENKMEMIEKEENACGNALYGNPPADSHRDLEKPPAFPHSHRPY